VTNNLNSYSKKAKSFKTKNQSQGLSLKFCFPNKNILKTPGRFVNKAYGRNKITKRHITANFPGLTVPK